MIATVCPYCGRTNDRHMDASNRGAMPKRGDFSFCWNCRRFAAYEDGLDGLVCRALTADETELSTTDPYFLTVTEAAKIVMSPTRAVRLIGEAIAEQN